MILQSTMAFFYKAAQVKKNWFWQYKVFSIIILQTAKIDPEWIFHPRPFRVFPMLLGVAALCHTRSRGSIQKPGKVIENHNACLKNELVCWGFFSFKSSMVGSFPLLSSPKAFRGLSGHLHKLSPQPEELGPSQERRKLRVPMAGGQSAKSTRDGGTTGGLPGAGQNVHPDGPQHCSPAVPCTWSVDCRYPSLPKSWNSCGEKSPACSRGGCRTPAVLPHSHVPGFDIGGGQAQAL